MKPGHVDINIVAYHSEKDLPYVVEGIERWTTSPWSLHLFDNAGNPKTLTIAWNDLAAQGEGEFVAFMNTDIRVSPGWDERLKKALEENPSIGVVMPRAVGHDWPHLVDPARPPYGHHDTAPAPGHGDMEILAEKYKDDPEVYSFGGECNASFYALVLRRKLFEDLKGFDERFRFYGQDHDFQRRMLARFGLYAGSVKNSPFWHRCAGSTREAAARGEVDFNAEMIHHGQLKASIAEQRFLEWDLILDEERQAVRKNPKFSKMPR